MKKTIYLAGGCFWGVEAYYRQLRGVLDTEVGYANGSTANPNYQDLKSGKADHAETVQIDYENEVISLPKLLEHYLRFVEPYSVDRQGHDAGHQYRTGIYCTAPSDEAVAKKYLDDHLKAGYAIEVTRLRNFYPAEEYHQDYLEKNPGGYCHVNLNLIQKDEKSISTRKDAPMEKDVNCSYCMENELLDAFGIKICDLKVSKLYLFKEQSHKGRVIVAYQDHVSEIVDLGPEERAAFFEDINRVANALHAAFHPAKINYGAYGDTGHHLHFHLVPKYKEDEFEWGGTFAMNPKRVFLSDPEYKVLIDQIKDSL